MLCFSCLWNYIRNRWKNLNHKITEKFVFADHLFLVVLFMWNQQLKLTVFYFVLFFFLLSDKNVVATWLHKFDYYFSILAFLGCVYDDLELRTSDINKHITIAHWIITGRRQFFSLSFSFIRFERNTFFFLLFVAVLFDWKSAQRMNWDERQKKREEFFLSVVVFLVSFRSVRSFRRFAKSSFRAKYDKWRTRTKTKQKKYTLFFIFTSFARLIDLINFESTKKTEHKHELLFQFFYVWFLIDFVRD